MGLSVGILHEELAKVAPIQSVREKDGAFEIVFNEQATPQQKTSAGVLLEQLKLNPPKDADLERIKTILLKSDDLIGAAELKELVLKFVRKRI